MKQILFCSLLFLSLNIFAGVPSLDNLSKDDFSIITKEFGANFIHASVTPPNSLGAVFGVEVGLVAGVTSLPGTEKVIQQINPAASDANKMIHAGIMAQVSVPYGISAEGTMFPEKDFSGVSIKTMSGALKWTITDSLLPLPMIDIAARVHMSSSSLSFKSSAEVSSVPLNTEISFDSSSFGTNLSIGANLFLVKPYIGFGYISTDNEFSVNSTSTIFNFTSSTSAKEKHSGSHIFAGVELDLFVVHIGAEYSKIMDVDRISTKLSVAF